MIVVLAALALVRLAFSGSGTHENVVFVVEGFLNVGGCGLDDQPPTFRVCQGAKLLEHQVSMERSDFFSWKGDDCRRRLRYRLISRGHISMLSVTIQLVVNCLTTTAVGEVRTLASNGWVFSRNDWDVPCRDRIPLLGASKNGFQATPFSKQKEEPNSIIVVVIISIFIFLPLLVFSATQRRVRTRGFLVQVKVQGSSHAVQVRFSPHSAVEFHINPKFLQLIGS